MGVLSNGSSDDFNPGSTCVINEDEGTAQCHLKEDVDGDGEQEVIGEIKFTLDQNNRPKARKKNFAEGFDKAEKNKMKDIATSEVEEELSGGPMSGHLD